MHITIDNQRNKWYNIDERSGVMEETQNSKRVVELFIIAAFIVALILIFGKKNTNHYSKDDKYIACYTYSQDLVKKKLKSPKSADFPLYSKSFVTDKGNTVLISAYVDANNSLGTSVRVYYTANIKVKDGEPVSGTATLIE